MWCVLGYTAGHPCTPPAHTRTAAILEEFYFHYISKVLVIHIIREYKNKTSDIIINRTRLYHNFFSPSLNQNMGTAARRAASGSSVGLRNIKFTA